MRWNRLRYVVLTLSWLLPTLQSLAAQCVVCGAPACDDWMCRPTRTNQVVEASMWDAVCEPICIPGCATKGCTSGVASGTSCDDAATCDGTACDDPGCSDCTRGNSLTRWLTGTRRVRMRHRLVRKTVVECDPTLQYAAEPRCAACCGASGGADCDAPGYAAPLASDRPVLAMIGAAEFQQVVPSLSSGAPVYNAGAALPPLPPGDASVRTARRPVQLKLEDSAPTVWLGSPSEPLPMPVQPSRSAAVASPGVKPQENIPSGFIRTVGFETPDDLKPATSTRR